MQSQVREKAPQSCWCGNSALSLFSERYLKCDACETLVLAEMPEHEIARVARDEAGIYGKDYWFSHQEENWGYPNIELRARSDLPERCLHWLKTLLRYRQPPASVLELGSAHGGFVALTRAAGFDATGLELSPSIANLARRFFDIPVLVGPLEDQKIQPASLDVVASFDVIEHFQDPVGSMRHCLALLKPNGLLLIQTPRYREGHTYDSMVAAKDPFLDQLKPDQHLYLFSESSIRLFFHRLGADFLEFEPPIFSHYDMFLLVSRQPLIRLEGAPRAFESGVSGRLLQAMLDLDASIQDLVKKYGEMDADRAARLEVILEQGARVGDLEAERNNLKAQIDGLSQGLAFAEADRAARLEVIHQQGAQVGELEAERNNLKAQLDSLSKSLAFAEGDRAARLDVIHEQGRSFADLQTQYEDLRSKLAEQQSLNQDINERLHESVAQLRTLQDALRRIRRSRIYRLLRHFGHWLWVEEILNKSFNDVSPHDENKTS
jgi:SAM-dependent methyltransferase/predicted nuclease with TOPRIM domain